MGPYNSKFIDKFQIKQLNGNKRCLGNAEVSYWTLSRYLNCPYLWELVVRPNSLAWHFHGMSPHDNIRLMTAKQVLVRSIYTSWLVHCGYVELDGNTMWCSGPFRVYLDYLFSIFVRYTTTWRYLKFFTNILTRGIYSSFFPPKKHFVPLCQCHLMLPMLISAPTTCSYLKHPLSPPHQF